MATVHLPICPRCTAGCLISLLRARKRGETFQWLWRQPKLSQRLDSSVDSFSCFPRMHSYSKHCRFDGWRTAQRRFSSRQRTSNWAACHLPWGSEGIDLFRPSFVHAWVWAHGASASCRGRSWGPSQGCGASKPGWFQPLRPVWSPNDGDLSSIFPSCFYHSLGSNCSLTALARSIRCLACLPELLNHFPNSFTPKLKLFCNGRITLTLFTEANDCFSVYCNRNNVIYIIWISEM